MLRIRVRRTTGSTGVDLTVTHGLGTTLDWWAFVPVSGRAIAPNRPAAIMPGANVITLEDSLATTVTLDVMCIAYQGRLY
jgi:hypothetical protein